MSHRSTANSIVRKYCGRYGDAHSSRISPLYFRLVQVLHTVQIKLSISQHDSSISIC